MVYADYTASGRSLSFVEDSIQKKVLPFYANTHSETSFSGKQTSQFRDQAKDIIRDALNTGEKHKVIFCGSGATAAINKLIDMLGLRINADLDKKYQFSEQINKDSRPVVFIGPYEHHSNELPWRESIVELVTIPLNSEGQIDQGYLAEQLVKHQARPLLIGSFSAASNVTGIKSDVASISKLLKAHNALSCWDYAAAAPYVGIDMQGDELDAVFVSPHKFIGGPGTPGILVVNSEVLKNTVPAQPGGGTVMYVTPKTHTFINDVERREEGGTPAIVESIRAGLVFQIQQAIGTDNIERLEHAYVTRAIEKLSTLENFELLGSPSANRLSILSFNIKHNDQVLHYGFVVALLNDLFGIQARGGCSCAGPYGHELLSLSMANSAAIEEQLHQGHMVLRPGWTRLNFNYFIDEDTFNYIVDAITLVAQHGWRMLAHYHFNQQNGTWQYRPEIGATTKANSELTSQVENTAMTLSALLTTDETAVAPIVPSHDLSQYLLEAKEALMAAGTPTDQQNITLTEQAEALRWFAVN